MEESRRTAPIIDELQEKIRQLETRVETLAAKLQKVDKQNNDWDEIRGEHLKIIDDTQRSHYQALFNAFERIKNLEAKLFPNMPADMVQIQDIIGEGDTTARNPLDHRK